MSESPVGIAGVFDRAADTYDAVGIDWFGPIAQGLVQALEPRPGERALDIGCGRGAALRPMALGVGPTGRALGFDLSPRMVQATAADLGYLPQVQVRVGDAMAPGLPSSSFDVISSSLVLFFMPDPAVAAAGWAELLVPDGRLGVSTFGPQDPRWVAVDELFTPFLSVGMLDARTSGVQGPFASDSGVEALLSAAGLVEVRTSTRVVQVVLESPEQWLAFSWSHGQRAMWEAVPPDRRQHIEQAALSLLAGYRDPSGRITFRQQVRYTLGRRPG